MNLSPPDVLGPGAGAGFEPQAVPPNMHSGLGMFVPGIVERFGTLGGPDAGGFGELAFGGFGELALGEPDGAALVAPPPVNSAQ